MVAEGFPYTHIDFSQSLQAQSMRLQQYAAICLPWPKSNKLIICFDLQQFSLAKPQPKKNLALFKWLLKHGCCPWILMAISLIVQSREGEISKLLTPQRISSGHNMSLSCQPVTFVYPWVCRAARCVTLLKKGNSLHAKEALVTVWITWGLVAYFYGRWRTGGHDWEWTCPCMFMEFCHARFFFFFSFFKQALLSQPDWWTVGAKLCEDAC